MAHEGRQPAIELHVTISIPRTMAAAVVRRFSHELMGYTDDGIACVEFLTQLERALIEANLATVGALAGAHPDDVREVTASALERVDEPPLMYEIGVEGDRFNPHPRTFLCETAGCVPVPDTEVK